MKITESPAAMLLAFRKDGTVGPRETCALCNKVMVEFTASPGMRRLAPELPARTTTCVNSQGPCFGALKAKPLMDALTRLC